MPQLLSLWLGSRSGNSSKVVSVIRLRNVVCGEVTAGAQPLVEVRVPPRRRPPEGESAVRADYRSRWGVRYRSAY